MPKDPNPALQIRKEEKANVDALKHHSAKKSGGPLWRGNLGRYGTTMTKPPSSKAKREKRFLK